MAAPKICAIDDCGNKAIARGWCSKHWSRWRKHGDPLKGSFRALDGQCSIQGCERKPHTRWKGDAALCNRHWLRLYSNGTPELRERVFSSWAICTEPGCDKEARSSKGKVCEMHYARKRVGYAGPFAAPAVVQLQHGYEGNRSLPHHPISGPTGQLYEHRRVLFEAIGSGPHTCEWCAKPIDWWSESQASKLFVDHLDGKKNNNTRSNLVASCHSCNVKRGMAQIWLRAHGARGIYDELGRPLRLFG